MPPGDQVNDPDTCPNVQCRSRSFDTYDEDRGSDYLLLKRTCEDCGWTWVDEYLLEFKQRTGVTRA